jgi:hypothetical protein
MKEFNNNFNKLLESYAPLKMNSRLFYPRNFSLSEEFIKSFKNEYQRLVKEGNHPKRVMEKISKALKFHING